MPAYPIEPNLTIYFNDGATFGYPFTLNSTISGRIGYDALGGNNNLIVDVTSQTIKATIKRGYNLLQGQFEAGQATFTLIDQNGYFNPSNTSSPYFGYLTPLRKIKFSASTTSPVAYYDIFSGYITAYNYSYDKDQNVGYVDLVCVDAFRLLNLAGITSVAGTSAGQDTGTRINKILDEVSFPSIMRSIQTGSTLVQADPSTTRTSLAAIQNCEFSEQGAFYIDKGGNATFLNRQTIQSAAVGIKRTFANDGSGISYFNINPAFDDKLIINEATITRVGGTPQTAVNSASVTKYFPHSVNYDNLVVQTDAEASNIANIYVATRAETTLRIDSLVLDLTTPNYASGIEAALDSEFFNNIRVINVGQDGSTIDKTQQIVGIAHNITPNTWKTTFTLSEPLVDAFILDSDRYGIIGTGVLTY